LTQRPQDEGFSAMRATQARAEIENYPATQVEFERRFAIEAARRDDLLRIRWPVRLPVSSVRVGSVEAYRAGGPLAVRGLPSSGHGDRWHHLRSDA